MAHSETHPALGAQFDLDLGDPESRIRADSLDVVHARALSVRRFDESLFAGFAAMRALTYTPSIPMVLRLLREHRHEDFECIFGHGGIVAGDPARLLSFQTVVQDDIRARIGVDALPDEHREFLYRRIADGTARFLVVKDAIAHAKIYLLEDGERRRVVVGSANLSETAFSGRQAETLVVFDDDQAAWEHYAAQYEAVRDIATSRLDIRPERSAARLIEDTPALRDAADRRDGVTIFAPPADEAHSVPQVVAAVERLAPARRRALADIRPDSAGNLRIRPETVKQITRIARARESDDEGDDVSTLSWDGRGFLLSGRPFTLDADPEEARGDVAAWLEFFDNYGVGFEGDVPRLQRDYFTFMSWFYLSPRLCDVRNAALRTGSFSFDQPMFAVVYGQSNCGKSSLVETLMTSMFGYPRFVRTDQFTRSNLRALQAAYRRFPVVFDDVTRERFSRHAPEVIKDETVALPEYPCFALSMNADARSFPEEIVKRCLMIYTTTSLPGDAVDARRHLQRSVAGIRSRMTTALFRTYLARLGEALAAADPDEDVLALSSTVLCETFDAFLPSGTSLPQWCAPVSLRDCQDRAFDRPKAFLRSLLHASRHSRERRPPTGCWNVVGDRVTVIVEPMTSRRIAGDIPDWILDDTASVSDRIVLKRPALENFLGTRVRPPRFWQR